MNFLREEKHEYCSSVYAFIDYIRLNEKKLIDDVAPPDS